ncbi:MAG: sulfotransferase [Phycisphaerales bacterium]|nr:sulfotransferase [Phycisphaerales bacterium]
MLLHIGYHKTGTTWLQRAVFSNPQAGFVAPWQGSQVAGRFVAVNAFTFDPEAQRHDFESELEAVRNTSPADTRTLVPVISHERLSGNPHSGGFDSKAIAERLAETFPGARVLIVIREQRAMLASIYKQYVKVGGAASLRRYIEPPTRGNVRVPLFRFDFLGYDLLIGCYQHLFGDRNVLVLPYEMLLADQPGFLRRIAEFAGAAAEAPIQPQKVNRSLPGITPAVLRRLNRFLVRDTVNPSAAIDVREHGLDPIKWARAVDRVLGLPFRGMYQRSLRTQIDRYAAGRCGESNRKTQGLTGLDLEGYGYEL